jgi:hypothetical protein
MIPTLMAVVVLLILGTTILTVSYSEDFNARREKSALLAFYAAEAGVHEALARMNLDPSGPSDDETEIPWGSGTGNPDSVLDPRMLQGNQPDPSPANYSDSSIPSYRFWNYDPAWRYSGTGAGGEGNYPGATSTQQANLALAGRAFTYASASPRTLPSGSSYAVRVVPHIRSVAATWSFVDERAAAAAANTYYYKVTSTGTYGAQSALAQVIVKKYFFGLTIPATIAAGGGVVVGGNATVTSGESGDENPTGVAIQSAGTASATGSGEISGSVVNDTTFPGFEAIFGMTTTEMYANAGIKASYTSNTSNPGAVPSGTIGKVIWITAKDGGLKKDITFTGSGPGGYMIGSASQPVIMVVDGNLNLNTVTFYGAIYVTGVFRNQGGSQIRGSIAVEGTAETDILGTGAGDGTKIEYSKSVLRNINEKLFPFRPVKGSWDMSRG